MNNRILAMLLAIIMIVSIVPVNAFAAGTVHAEGCAAENGLPCDKGCEINTAPTPVVPGAHEHVDTYQGGNGICDISGCTEHVHQMQTVAANAATCTETGISATYYKCQTATCGKAYKDAEGKTEATESDYILNKVAHSFGGTYVGTDPVGHYKTCTVCGEKSNLIYHNSFKYETVDGKKVKACGICGYAVDHECKDTSDCKCDECMAPVHATVLVEAKDAKCGEKGNVVYYYCEKCKLPYSDEAGLNPVLWKDVEIAALSHEYAYTERAYGENKHDAKCTKCGFETEGTCKDEDGNHKCDKCQGMLLHGDMHVTTSAKKPATCTEPGLADHYVCVTESCGSLFLKENGVYVPVTKEQIAEIPATGHAPSNHIYHDEESHWQLCNNGCDAILNETEHVPGEWRLYPSDNSKHFQICTVCTETLAPVVHEYEYTAQKYGDDYHAMKCKVCGYDRTRSCVDADKDHKCDDCGALIAKVHETGLAYVKKVDAKCETTGMESHYKCETCQTLFGNSIGATVVTEADLTIAALGHKAHRAWETDGTGHWKKCKHSGCEEKLEYAEHTPGECHEYPSDKSKHFQQCTVCVRSLNIQEHVYTCTSNGDGWTHTAECKPCGKVRATAGCYDKNADCFCDECNGLMGHVRNGLTYHGYTSATCTVDGHHGYMTCNTCGNTFANEKDAKGFYIPSTDYVIPALGHDWGTARQLNGSVYHSWHCQRVDCNAAKIELHDDANDDCVCDTCGAFAHGAIKYMEPVEATCTEDGRQGYYYYDGCGKKFADAAGTTVLAQLEIYKATGHDEHGEWEACEDGVNHVKYCLTCEELLETEEHDFSSEAPYCVKCGAAEGLEPVAEVKATCTSTGMKAHWISSITNRRYSDAAGTKYISDVNSLVIPKLSHAMDVESSNGKTHIIGCANCDEAYEEACSSEDGNCVCDFCNMLFAGHKLTAVEGKAPTCTKKGQAESLYCAKCDKYYAAEDGSVLATIEIKALGHKYESKWYNDAREGTHSKDCLREGCHEKISEEHDLTAYDIYSGNLHEWRCSICEYKESEIHADSNGDSICDECGHGSNKAVDAGDLDNPRDTVTIKVDKEATTQEKQNTWWKNFVGKLNPSYVGESQSSSAPSASVESVAPNGSGVSSGSTSGAGQNVGTSAPSSSTIGSVVNFLMNLLSTLFGI